MGTPRKQVILAAHFPGVNNTTVWSDPRRSSQIEFDSFVHLARTAERGKFDFFFLAEGLRLREQRGRIHDLDVVGPARHAGRARRAGRGDHAPRPGRHAQRHVPRALRAGPPAGHARPPVGGPGRLERGHLLRRLHRRELPAGRLPRLRPTATSGPASSSRTARQLWDSWAEDEVVADQASGPVRAPRARPGAFAHRGRARSTSPATSTCPAARRCTRSSCRPATATAGASSPLPRRTPSSAATPARGGRAFYADAKGRLARYGRRRDDLKILPGVDFVLGDTREEAAERAHAIRRQQVSPQTAHPAARAAVEPRPVGLRPRRPAARRRPRRVVDLDHPGPGPAATRPAGDGGASGGRWPRPRA